MWVVYVVYVECRYTYTTNPLYLSGFIRPSVGVYVFFEILFFLFLYITLVSIDMKK